VAGSCEYGDDPSVCGATELVSYDFIIPERSRVHTHTHEGKLAKISNQLLFFKLCAL
jgi:hypothetical protein